MTLRSKAFARILDLVAEGEIEGLVAGAKSIYLNGTPLQNPDNTFNFQDVEFDSRPGTQAQTYIDGIPAVESETTVNTEVTNATPVVRTISSADVDAVRVTVYVPALYFQNSQGDLDGQSVEIAIDVQPSGGSYATALTDTISGKTTSKYQRSYRVNLPGSAPWNIRVRRITADSTNVRLVNETYWESFTAIIDSKLRYPNSALVGMRFDATAFQGIPTRGYDLKLKRIKVPSNYNPTTRAYSGVWNGTFTTAWSDNPAWCFYDLVTNSRYGLGEYIPEAQVDKWALYTIGQYCDELVPNGLGGTEPRFTCNLYLQSREEAFKVINDMASCFRSMVYWAGGAMTLSQDAPSDPVALFSQANVVEGLFTYQGSSAKARHTVALVTWNDPDDLYKQKIEYVEDTDGIARYGVVPTEVVAIGCTSRGQANRVGRWLLYAERNETETVTFATGIEGATVRPGDIIKVADASRAGVRLGGRVRTATTTAVTVDAAVALGASSWTLYAMLPDGSVGTSQVSSAAGNVVNLVTALASAPQAGAQWIMTSAATEAQTFRVLNVVERGNNEIEITALKHEPLKYDAVETGLVLPERTITVLTFTPDAPAALAVSEALYTYQAEVRAKVSIAWANVGSASAYRVQWSKDDGNFVDQITSVSDFELLNITPGTFTIRVYSIGPTGNESSTYAEATFTALGKTAPPSNVANLAASIDKDIGATLTWDKVADLDLDAYEIRLGSTWATATLIGQVKATVYSLGYIPPGSQTYLVKALDTSGNYSATAASITVSLSAPSAVSLTQEVIDNNVLLRWTEATATLSIRHYTVRRGATYATATEIGTVAGRFSAIFETVAGTFTYWVAAVDLAGNVGTPTPVTALVSQPPDYQLKFDLNSTFSGTQSNMAAFDGKYLAPADTTETWQSHFTSRSWNTPQDQINAGYPVYAMPSAAAGYYEETIDYGTVLASTKISATLSYVTAAGTVTVTPKLSVRKLVTDPWTDYAGLSSVFVTDFRYVKVRFDFATSGGDDFITITGLNIRFDVKLKNDAGTATANSGDTGGTTVNFNTTFVDVESITVTPKGTAARIAVYDFVDVPNPTSFKVLLFDTAGTRVTGDVSWSVKGI